MDEHPQLLQCFNSYMGGYRQGKRSWAETDFYPIEERLAKGLKSDEDAVFVVDVGGGMGHDLEEVQAKHPGLVGRLILQEREEVVRQIQGLNSGIEVKVHDFFTEQPVKGGVFLLPHFLAVSNSLISLMTGARAYYLHSILHNWDDDACRKILKPLVSAMERSYSRLLINELVIPDVEAPWSVTSTDWMMMALCATRERTEKAWHQLLGSVGLAITKIWAYEQGTESLIEAEPAG